MMLPVIAMMALGAAGAVDSEPPAPEAVQVIIRAPYGSAPEIYWVLWTTSVEELTALKKMLLSEMPTFSSEPPLNLESVIFTNPFSIRLMDPEGAVEFLELISEGDVPGEELEESWHLVPTLMTLLGEPQPEFFRGGFTIRFVLYPSESWNSVNWEFHLGPGHNADSELIDTRMIDEILAAIARNDDTPKPERDPF